jgi:hypothetical protein
LKVKGDGVSKYFANGDGQTGREIQGLADVTDSSGNTKQERYILDVADDGEPGIGVDHFTISLPDHSPSYTATGDYDGTPPLLDGGNVKLHRPISCP